MAEELFEVTINEEGYYWLKRFGRWTAIILIITFVVNISNLAVTVPFVLRASKNGLLPSKMEMRNLIFIIYLFVSFVLQIIQIIFYRSFASKAQKGIEGHDSFLFNRSFRLLLYQSICFFIQLLISFVYFVYTFLGSHF